MGYLTISRNVRRYKTHHRWHFFFQEDSALVHMHCACNSMQLLQRSRLPFSWTMPPTAPRWAHWLQDSGSHTAAWVWVVSQKDWRNQGGTSWILAMHWYSIWVKHAIFVFPRFDRYCRSTSYLGWHSKASFDCLFYRKHFCQKYQNAFTYVTVIANQWWAFFVTQCVCYK